MRWGAYSIPLPLQESYFSQVPNALAPSYAPIVVHLKLVVILLLVWHINFVAAELALARRLKAVFCASAVIGMDFTSRTDCSERMLCLDPQGPLVTLRAFDFHCHFQAFTPHLASSIIRVCLSRFDPDAGKFP